MKKTDDVKIVRTEILFSPLLILLPFFVAALFLFDWFYRGYFLGGSAFNGELIIGIIILVGNILFDIPFIRSLRSFKKR